MLALRDRLVNNPLAELQNTNYNPIQGYENEPLLPLEAVAETMVPFIPPITDYVAKAKEKCSRKSHYLTLDESAAIYLYTMPTIVFSLLNQALRTKDQNKIKPWFSYLKLLLTALEKLPSVNQRLWRGASAEEGASYSDGDVHILWSIISCSKDLGVVETFLGPEGTVLAMDAMEAKDVTELSALSEEKEFILMPGTRVRACSKSISLHGSILLIHLKEENIERMLSSAVKNDLFEPIRQKYLQENAIKSIVYTKKSFSIEQSYINLKVVKSNAQQKRQKQLKEQDGQQHYSMRSYNTDILDTYEKIYGEKEAIDVKDIFKNCTDQIKKISVLGRAGIGKSTFCQYVAYRWAKGELWSEFELLVLIHLRKLTDSRYPQGIRYSPVNLLENEYFPCNAPSEEQRKTFRLLCDKQKVLWVLDGYDEWVQNMPGQLKDLFDHLLEKQHYILTSRPYVDMVPHDVRIEIIGFTNDNIICYVNQFFDQINDERSNVSLKCQKLLQFLESNSSIWEVARTPVNLQLICSLWNDTNCSKTAISTITKLYDNIIEWFCRRYFEKQNIDHQNMTKLGVYAKCNIELQFLEHLAFKAMERNQIMLSPKLLEETEKELKAFLHENPLILNMGFLKSSDNTSIGNKIATKKQNYFIHLSFQEHFAARHLLKILKSSDVHRGIDFIKQNKYNQRFRMVFIFSAGLLVQSDFKSNIDTFLSAMQQEPLDLIGLQHTKLFIECNEEFGEETDVKWRENCIKCISSWLDISINSKVDIIGKKILEIARSSSSILKHEKIQTKFIQFLQENDKYTIKKVLTILSEITILQPQPTLLCQIGTVLYREDSNTKVIACRVLGNIGKEAIGNEAIVALVDALQESDSKVRIEASKALVNIGKVAVTNEIITVLISKLNDNDSGVQKEACHILGKIGERAATKKTAAALINALQNKDSQVRREARKALENIGREATTNNVTAVLITSLKHKVSDIRYTACYILGNILENAFTNEITVALVNVLLDEDSKVRVEACKILANIGRRAIMNETIDTLITALEDEVSGIRCKVCCILRNINEREVTEEIIFALLKRLQDTDSRVKVEACRTLGEIVGKQRMNDVIIALSSVLHDEDPTVGSGACEALGKIGEKATTDGIITALITALRHTDSRVRGEASKALVNICKITATNELTTALINVIEYENTVVKREVSNILGNIGERLVTQEIVAALLMMLRDRDPKVKSEACKALGNIGRKAISNEVITTLISVLEDENPNVRSDVCEALGKIGEKAAIHKAVVVLVNALRDDSSQVESKISSTHESISKIAAMNDIVIDDIDGLQDNDSDIKNGACKAFENIGKIAVTNKLINALIKALKDGDVRIRRKASKALGNIGKIAVTNEVIDALIKVLQDDAPDVRDEACQALGNIGKVVVTDAVIDALIKVLQDDAPNVRSGACVALGNIGHISIMKKVIIALISAFRDRDAGVRSEASKALGNIGEIAVTNEVITGLISVLDDEDSDVSRKACDILGNIGETEVTYDIVIPLVNALQNNSFRVRSRVCYILGKIGEKTPMNEIIIGLVNRFEDENKNVRFEACRAIGNIGEKAASTQVITALVKVLNGKVLEDKSGVCWVLRNLGEKIITKEVMIAIMNAIIYQEISADDFNVRLVLERVICSYEAIQYLDSSTASKLLNCARQKDFPLEILPLDYLIRVLFKTRNFEFIPLVAFAALMQGTAVTFNKNIITIYGSGGILEFNVLDADLLHALTKGFRQLHTKPDDMYNAHIKKQHISGLRSSACSII